MGTKPNLTADNSLRDHLLVLRCQVGDEAAFSRLYQQFSHRTLGFIRSFVSAQEAEDINQELWLMVYKRVAELARPAGFKAWLFQSARNRALDYLRNHKRSGALLQLLKTTSVAELADPEQELPEFQDKLLVLKALEQLSGNHREVLVLYYLEGMDYEEIALITGASLGTVKSRLHHAKNKLKEIITLKR